MPNLNFYCTELSGYYKSPALIYPVLTNDDDDDDDDDVDDDFVAVNIISGDPAHPTVAPAY